MREEWRRGEEWRQQRETIASRRSDRRGDERHQKEEAAKRGERRLEAVTTRIESGARRGMRRDERGLAKIGQHIKLRRDEGCQAMGPTRFGGPAFTAGHQGGTAACTRSREAKRVPKSGVTGL